MADSDTQPNNSRQTALKFVVLVGVVSLFSDITYEGARSIHGPFLALLGASAATVGVVAGLGEMVAYALRLVFGYLSDRTGRYWTITIAGYILNLFAVPALALAGNWPMAAALMVAERLGKAVRSPARDAMLSHASHHMGRGWAFGLHEALDQIGAVAGPLVVAAVMHMKSDYRASYALLIVPALMAMLVLLAARWLYPTPRDLEDASPHHLESQGITRVFWLYLGASALVAAGFADYPLAAYHFQKTGLINETWIPILYSVAMGVDALAALWLGRSYDRKGLSIMVGVALLSALVAPLVFLGGFWLVLAGMILWGVGMAAQESVMRAAVAGMIPADKRGSAYGLFSAGYGVAWFLGSAIMGFLYDWSVMALVAFSVAMQLLSAPLLLMVSRRARP